MAGPLPATTLFAEAFRSAIMGKLREGGANYQRLRPLDATVGWASGVTRTPLSADPTP